MAQQDIQYIFRDIFFSVQTWTLIFYGFIIAGVAFLLWGTGVESIGLCLAGIGLLGIAAFLRAGDSLWEWLSSPWVWHVVGSWVVAMCCLLALFLYAPNTAVYVTIALAILGAIVFISQTQP